MSLDMSSVEVIYNCKGEKDTIVKISMTVTTSDCDPFTIAWQKQCKAKGKYWPH
jgi:hypothetical protein